MMSWRSFNLGADEEKRIHQCCTEALQELIDRQIVKLTDDEKTITGALRPIFKRVRKHRDLRWSLHAEASTFDKDDDSNPFGHPDIQLTRLDTDNNQYDYDIECKLVRIKRPRKNWDYCNQYVKNGILRYQLGKYAQSIPPMGTMLGYVQEGDFNSLLHTINENAKQQGLNELRVNGKVRVGGVTNLSHKLKRENDQFTLHHLWADFRFSSQGSI